MRRNDRSMMKTTVIIRETMTKSTKDNNDDPGHRTFPEAEENLLRRILGSV